MPNWTPSGRSAPIVESFRFLRAKRSESPLGELAGQVPFHEATTATMMSATLPGP
jgi:hypothetical protein